VVKFIINQFIFYIIPVAILVTTCKNRSSTASDIDGEDTIAVNQAPVVSTCIWDKTPVRDSARRASKWLTSLKLGETIYFMNSTKIDSSYKNREYLFCELTDGTRGWVPSFGVVKNSRPATIIKDTPLYLRPDLMTITGQTLPAMEFICVSREKDEWVEIITSKKKKKGWIPKENISTDKQNIAFANEARVILTDNRPDPEHEKYKYILDNTSYPNSVFIQYVKEMHNKLKDEYLENHREPRYNRYREQYYRREE
jgi:hypothetical protein